jgi:hypothetical protein
MDLSRLQPDFETVFKRYEAFWERSILDRPLVSLKLPRGPGAALPRDPVPVPEEAAAQLPSDKPRALRERYPDYRARWLDIDARVERLVRQVEQFDYRGDALPIVWPNMGPEIFSAWCGAGYEFGRTTTWSTPVISNWETDAETLHFSSEHPLFRATLEFTEKLVDASGGEFIVGLTDFHPGGDHAAALRDPESLAVDLIENPQAVKRLVHEATEEYFQAYDLLYRPIAAAGMPATSWLDLIAFSRYYIPSNDFSIMISEAMFEEFFLPGIVRECAFLDRSIYHLDGPGALRHLDAILGIEDLDAVQFVPGAGNEGVHKWMDVYRRIQNAGKGLQILNMTTDDIELVMEQLRPEGVYIPSISGVRNADEADAVLRRLAAWR